MANQEQLEILKQGVDVWNKWRKENPDVMVDLIGADLAESNLVDADLRKVNLSEAKLQGAWLNRINYPMIGLRYSSIDIRTNLSKANLTKANLNYAHLFGANLEGANLNKARLGLTDLSEANLKKVNLCESFLVGTNLSRANLNGTDLSYSAITGVNLSGTNLTETNFTNAGIGHAIFGDIDLSMVIGLDTIKHYFPSTIGADTFQMSKGRIPIEFLQGCGLSNLDIEYSKLANPDLSEKEITGIIYKIHNLRSDGVAVQYCSAFISYSSKDQDFAQRLYNELQNSGVRCWFAPEDMKIGDLIRPTIDQEVRLRDKLLVILSENSVKSEWVGDEVEAALEEESASGRSVLFPIRLDDAVMETRDDWAAKIKRRRHIGDFSNWKDEGSYRKAFERLLRDLKATSNTGNQE